MPFQEDIHALVNNCNKYVDEENPFASNDDSGEKDPLVDILRYVRDLTSTDTLDPLCREHSYVLTPAFLSNGDTHEKVKPSLGRAGL